MQEWDVSAVDRALGQGIVARDADTGEQEAIASGEDVRIALVEREGADASDLVSELEQLSFVEAAQPNYVMSIDSAAVNDPLYDEWQYALHDETAGIDVEAALAARQSAASTSENIVAVIDTGVDGDHPDLASSMWQNPGINGLPGAAGSWGYDFTENDDDPSPGIHNADSHGTHCAGVIAGMTNNAEGVAGASSDTKVMALKVCASDGSGAVYSSDVCSAFEYVIGAALASENVVATSNSWHAGGYQPVLDYLVNQAGKLGILLLFAAGNENIDTIDGNGYGATAALESPYAVIIASSNEDNALSTFSNWNETEVDLAFPGSQILSTVSADAAATFFSPALSLADGRDLVYCDDFSSLGAEDSAYDVAVFDSDGQRVTDGRERAFSVTPAEDAVGGQPGLEVVYDQSIVEDGEHLVLGIKWEFENPFRGTSRPAEDYALGISCETPDAPGTDTIAMVEASIAGYDAEDGSSFGLSSCTAGAKLDNSSAGSASLMALDTEGEYLTGQVMVDITTSSDASAGQEVTVCISPFGIGQVAGEGVTAETSDYAPYALMSGTSMATPLASGTVAQMAALDKNASALELRGRLVGSTVSVRTSYHGAEKHTATDGRFDWGTALDEGSVSANTHSLDADASSGSVTVRGHGLADAMVTLDGANVAVTEQADDHVTFTAPASAFDGESHRVDVTDASTQRAHHASYPLPIREASYDLSFAGELPDVGAHAAYGALVPGSSTLYFADRQGAYLYRTSYPESEGWTACEPAGTPWHGDTTLSRTALTYASVGDDVWAFAVEPATAHGSDSILVYAARYDAASNAWSAFEPVADFGPDVRVDNASFSTLHATVSDGTLYVLASSTYTTDQDTDDTMYAVLERHAGAGSFDVRTFTYEDAGAFAPCTNSIVATDDGFQVLGTVKMQAEDDDDAITTELHAIRYDAANHAWEDRGAFEGVPNLGDRTDADLFDSAAVPFGGGLLVFGSWEELTGDVRFVDFETLSVHDGASVGVASSTPVVVSSAAVYEGAVYANGMDGDPSPGTTEGALYALPYRAAEQLADVACPTESYGDIDHNAWYHASVDWAVTSGVMQGTDLTVGLFEPHRALTRAEMAQVFYNLAGSPEVEGESSFADCEKGAWYQKAVAWCEQKGLFEGYDEGTSFGPNDTLSREQMALVLWRLAGGPAAESDPSCFTDESSISGWAREAVEWAVAEGYLRGIGETSELAPADSLERAQAATIIMRADRNGFAFPMLAG